MGNWLTSMTIGQIAIVVGSLTVILGGVWRAWRAVRPMWRGLGDFLEDWRGEAERPGIPRRPGVMERLAKVEAALSEHITQHQTG